MSGKRAPLVGMAFALLLAAAPCAAEEPLRWKFAVDNQLASHVELVMRLKLDGPSGAFASEAREVLEMTWRVRNVTLTGDAVLVGRCDRVEARLATENGEPLVFDSSSDEPTTGLAAMMAPMYESMMAGEYQVTVTPRGEVRDVRIPADMEEAIRTTPGAESTGPEAAVDAFRAMLTAWIVPLPAEPPSEGTKWSTRSPAAIPGIDGAEVVTEYEYAGTREVDGQTYAVFRIALELKLADKEESAALVKEEQTGGEAMFNAAAGRLRWMRIEHRATLAPASEGEAGSGTIDQVIDVVVTPRE